MERGQFAPGSDNLAAPHTERVTEGSTQYEIKMKASRLNSWAVWKDPVRAFCNAKRMSTTIIIATSGHKPLNVIRAVSPPMHVHEGKRKSPTSKLNASRNDIHELKWGGRAKP